MFPVLLTICLDGNKLYNPLGQYSSNMIFPQRNIEAMSSPQRLCRLSTEVNVKEIPCSVGHSKETFVGLQCYFLRACHGVSLTISPENLLYKCLFSRPKSIHTNLDNTSLATSYIFGQNWLVENDLQYTASASVETSRDNEFDN